MFNTANIGSVDRPLRMILGLVLVVIPHVFKHEHWATPYMIYGMTSVGVILILTAFIRFCPLYRIIGVNSCKVT